LTAVFRKVPEGYIGFVEKPPGANTQGATLAETRRNLREAIRLCWKPIGRWRSAISAART
jgi:predicted RNase H-like HicB family nuclease